MNTHAFDTTSGSWPRRRVLKWLAAAGLANAVFGRALVTVAEGRPRVTTEMLDQASWVSGVELTPEERELMLEGVNELIEAYEKNRQVEIDNGVAPALVFMPVSAPGRLSAPNRVDVSGNGEPRRPSSEVDLAFAGVSQLAGLLRSRQVSSVELTRLYLERLRRLDGKLECVISLTEEPGGRLWIAVADVEDGHAVAKDLASRFGPNSQIQTVKT